MWSGFVLCFAAIWCGLTAWYWTNPIVSTENRVLITLFFAFLLVLAIVVAIWEATNRITDAIKKSSQSR